MKTYGRPYQSRAGAWFRADMRAGVPVRIMGPKDSTYRQRVPYHPACGSCWLGHAHSMNVHRYNLEERLSPQKV